MRGTVLSGSWSTWDGGGRGKRRSKTLRWRRSAGEERLCCFEKKWQGLLEVEDPRVPGEPKDGRGGSKPVGFLDALDGKTLKHAKTTKAENKAR
jgi:hypothetical protein